MFKSSRWRSDKTKKIKAVFKLTFHATQLPQLKKNKLTLTLVPEDAGKQTVRLEKAAVSDGACSWENPIYETVKFTRDVKTGKINEKIYYFVVSSSSAKSGFVGEVSFDFAEYAEASVPLTVSLPFLCSNSVAHMHVTIQNMLATVDEREPCKTEHATEVVNFQDASINPQMTNHDRDVNGNIDINDDGYFSTIMHHTVDQNGSFKLPSSSNSTTADANPEQTGKSDSSIKYENHQRSSSDWSLGTASDGSITDSRNSQELNFTSNAIPETSDGIIDKRKSEVFILLRQREVMELELQSLRKQVANETKKGQDLSRQVTRFKQERNEFKEECEQLKSFQKSTEDEEISNRLRYEAEESRNLLNEIRKELTYERKLSTSFQSQLQKTQESNAELILALRDLEEILEHKNEEISHLSKKIETNINGKEEEKKALEESLKHNESKVDSLKQKITELYGEIEFYKMDKEDLDMQMDQLNLHNENLSKEKHDISLQLEQNLLQQMKMQNEQSGSLDIIKELKSQVERLEIEITKRGEDLYESVEKIEELEIQNRNLETELEKQAEAFENDIGAVTYAKVEQEQRAIQAEEALRKTRQNNTITAERLQEEFKKLTVEMASKFDENETLAMNAIMEANELRLQKGLLEEKLEKADEELELIKDQHDAQIQELLMQIDVKSKEIEKMILEFQDKSKQFEYTKMKDEKMYETITEEIQMLRSEIERLNMEKDEVLKKPEQKEILRNETEIMVQGLTKERDDLERKFSLAKIEAETLKKEINSLTNIKDEKEKLAATSLKKVEGLKMQYNELKHCFAKEQEEKEYLRKQVILLKTNLQRKEAAIISKKKMIKENSGRGTISHSDVAKMNPKNNNSIQLPQNPEEVAGLKEKLKLLQEQIEIKEAEMKKSHDSFVTKEKDLKLTIKELENCIKKKPSTETGTSNENGVDRVPAKRNVETCTGKECPISGLCHSKEGDLTGLLTEVEALKKRNQSMEGELRDIQERYSEISLRFAEVEGERQQLVMTVRNLKSGKKN